MLTPLTQLSPKFILHLINAAHIRLINFVDANTAHTDSLVCHDTQHIAYTRLIKADTVNAKLTQLHTYVYVRKF